MRVALARNGVIYNIIEVGSVAIAQQLFPDSVVFEASREAIGWMYANGEWVEPDPVEPEPVLPVSKPPTLLACALRVPVINGEVQQVSGAYRIGGMFLLDEGTFLAFFTENLGEQEPFLVPNNGVSVSIAEWGQDYAVIEIREHAGGTLLTPTSFGFTLYNF